MKLKKLSWITIALPCFTFVIGAPYCAQAHVKWFVEATQVSAARPYAITDGPVLIWLLVCLVILGIATFLERTTFSQPVKRLAPNLICLNVVPLFSIMVGLGLMLFSWHGYMFAPNLIPNSSPFGFMLLITQGIIGLAFVFRIFVSSSAVLLFLLYGATILYFGFWEMSDALEILGIASMLLLLGQSRQTLTALSSYSRIKERYSLYAVPLLRVFTGMNLIVLGFSEKILHPELGMVFLARYHWNFMQMFGFSDFTDYWFVLSAGIVEALFGLVFILGLTTRITTVALAPFFIATLILLGPIELLGHILHFAILLVLFIFGSGEKLKLIHSRDKNPGKP